METTRTEIGPDQPIEVRTWVDVQSPTVRPPPAWSTTARRSLLCRAMRAATAAGALAAFFLVVPGTAAAEETAWEVDAARSKVTINVYRAGTLSAFLHDHHFVPESWSANARFDPSSPENAKVEVTVRADSLRDHQPELSAEDKKKVEQQVASAKILDAERHPEIVFRADSLSLASDAPAEPGVIRGTLNGTLSLRGETRPVRVRVAARTSEQGVAINGNVSLSQREFGIEPYSTAMGAIAVRDRVDITFSLEARPAP